MHFLRSHWSGRSSHSIFMDMVGFKMNKHHHNAATGILWNRYFILACLICLFVGFAMNMLNSTMAKYVYSLYGNASFSGLLNAAFAVMAIIGRLLAGDLSDKKGKRRITLWGGCIFAVSIICFGMFPFAATLVLFRGLQGFGYSMCTTANYAAGSDVLPPKRLGEGIGYMGLGYSLAMAIGPALALGLIHGTDYTPMFAVTTLMVVLAVIFAIANRYETKEEYRPSAQPVAQEEETPRGIASLIERNALPATVIQLFHCLAFAAVNSFIVIYAESRGITGTAWFFTCMAIAMCLTRLFAGRLTDTYGEIAVVLPCLMTTVLGFLLLIWTRSNLVFYVTGFLVGISTGIVNPVLQAAAIRSSPANRRGAANGTYQLSNDLANGLGAVLWGVTIDLWGYTATFVGCILCVAVSICLLIVLFKKQSS